MAKQLNVNLAFSADASKAKAQIQDLQNQLSKLIQQNVTNPEFGISKELKEATTLAASLKTKIEECTNVSTGRLDLGKFSQSLKQSNLDIDKLKASLESMWPAGTSAFASLARSITLAEVPMRNLNSKLAELGTTLKNTARWQISSSILHGFMGTVQSAYGYAQDLNESLNNIRIVTGQNTEQMAEFAEKANKAAKALSTTTTAYTNAALIYYQQGDDDATVLEKTDVTAKMANVTGTSAEEVSDQLTAIWNNFNKSGEESYEKYADILTALGAATASSTDEIAGGLEKFASIADMIGLSYEYAASALATITATTRQSEDVVGTALKTIFARIQGLSLGETLEDGTNLNKYSEALSKVGISIFEQNGQLKDMDDILDEMGAKWETLSKDQQVALAQTVAGVRQYNQLVSLMDSWDFMEQNLDTAYNAEGTLDEQAEIYAESWEAASKRAKAAAEDIYDSILDDKFFIGITNIFADFLEGISNVTDSLGGLKGILLTLSTILLSVFKTQIGETLNNLNYNLQRTMTLGRDAAAETVRANAQAALKNMAMSNAELSGEIMGGAYGDQAVAQEEYLARAQKMTEEQRKIAEFLLQQHQTLVDNTIAQGQVAEKAKEQAEISIRASNDKAKSSEDPQVLKWTQQYQNAAKQAEAFGEVAKKSFVAIAGEVVKDEKQVQALSNNFKALNKIIGSSEGMIEAFGDSGAQAFADLGKALDSGDMAEIDKQISHLMRTIEEMRANAGDLEGLLIGETISSEDVTNLQNAGREFGKLTSAAIQTSVATDGFGASLDKIPSKVTTGITSFVNFAQKASAVAMAVSSLKGLFDTWNDEDMSFGDKLIATFSTLGMVIPMVTTAVSGNTLAQIANRIAIKAANAAGLETVKNKAGEVIAIKAATVAKNGETKSVWANVAAKIAELAVSTPLLVITLAILAAIVALTAIIWLAVKAFQAWQASSPEQQLKNLEERANKSAEAFNRVQESVNETREAIEELRTSYDVIDDLTVGTEEWREAIEDVNTQLLELIDKYPELINFVGRNAKTGMLELSEEGFDYLEKASTDRLNAANSIKIKDQIAVQEKRIENSYLDFKHINNRTGLSSEWAEAMQEYYNTVGEQMFTDAGAQGLMETFQSGGYGTVYDQDDFKKLIENNKEALQQNAAKQKEIDLLKDMDLEFQASQLGSNRSASDLKDLLGDNTYDTIVEDKKADVKKAFGDWNDHINYKEGGLNTSNEEWKMIEDFMKLQGDDVKYVAQRKGKMVLEVDGEEIEYSKDEVYDSLAQLYSSPDLKETLETSLKNTLSETLGNSVDHLDFDQITALDNFRNNLTRELTGTEIENNVDNIFKTIVEDYGTSDQGINNFIADTKYVDLSSEAFIRQATALENGVIKANEFTAAVRELNAQGQILAMGDYFADAAEGLGLDEDVAKDMQEYAEHLRSLAKDPDVKGLADSLAEDAESAADLSVEITRMNSGIDKLADGFKDWRDILEKSSKQSAEYAEAMAATKDALSDVLDVEADLISNDFVTQHFDKIAEAATGSETAIDELRALMDEEIVAKISIGQTEEFKAQLIELDNTLKSELDRINEELPDIEVGAILQDQAFLDAANNLVEQSGMTADEANAYFAGIGYEPVYSTEEIQDGNTMETPNAQTEVALTGVKWSEQNVSIGNHELPIKAPAFTISTKSTPLPAEKAEANVRLTSFSGDGKPPKIKGLRKKATGSMNNYSSSNSGGKAPGSSSKSGGSKGSEPKKVKQTSKSEIVDRYKEVEDKIDDVAEAMDDASKAADRLYGSSRIKKMQEVNNLIQKEIGLLEEKKDEAEKYLALDKSNLQNTLQSEFGKSFTFDEKGNISNYDTVMTDLYNQLHALESANGGMADEKQNEAIETLREKIDKVKKALSQYDDTRELMEDLDNDIQDKIYEWQDNNYEMLQYKLEVKIELNDDDLKKIDYYLNKYSDNFYKMAESAALMNDKINPTIQNLEDYKSHKEALDESYRNGKISQEAYIEGLKEVREGYYNNLEALIELDKAMMYYYGDTLDAASEELSTFTDHMEHLTSVFDHYMSLMEILGKQKDYDAMGNFLGGKADTIRDRLDVAKEYYEMLKENSKADEYWANYQAALSSGDEDMAQWWKEQWDAEVDALDAAQAEMLGLTEEWAEAMKAVIENNMAKISDTLEKSLTNGLGFDKLMDDFDKLNTRQEEYLTKTNQIYETNKLMRTASKALDETDNKVAKQKLKNFIDETKSLQENTQLSKYELEIQQAKYDLLLAEIALEEAQNAKSTVRLSRDNEGNFGYVYTADQDAIDDAQQAYEDADNRLYNLSLEGQQEFTEKYIQATQEMYNQLTELQQAWLNGEIASEEEYERRKEEILNHYLGPDGVLTTYQNLYNIAVRTDADATADNWQKDYAAMTQNTEDWKIAVNDYLIEVEDQTAQWAEISEQANEDVEDALDDTSEATENLTDESENLKDMINREVIPAIEDELDWVRKQTDAYAKQRGELLALIRTYEDYINTINQQIKKEASPGYDKNTDYSAVMAGYLASGGAIDSDIWKEVERQREAKIEGEGLKKDYYGSRVGEKDYNPQASNKWYEDKDAVNEILKKLGIQTFSSGGYTGDWGPEGKLAILHEKEVVLNAEDTSNLLHAISFIRDIISMIDTQATYASLRNQMSVPGVLANSEALEQTVTIHAEFPNVINHNEIEEAFNNLINTASQYANRK